MENFTVGDYVFATILEAVPNPIFIVDDDVRIYSYNMPGARLIDSEQDKVGMGFGNVLHCIHSKDSIDGCGGGGVCKKCVIRKSVNQSYHSDEVVREKHEMQLKKDDKIENINTMVTTAPINYCDKALVLMILEDISELMELRNILPICIKCKKIRDDKEYWQNVERYLSKYSDIKFSRGICPKCLKIIYPDFRD
jgi:hypothetical protein